MFSRLVLLAAAAVLLSGCTEIMLGSHVWKKGTTKGDCAPEGYQKVGNPYLIDGVRYTPIETSQGYSERGIASWYGDDFHGKATANGECYNMYAFTAAHRTLPLPTIARITNLENNRSVVVKINDRGPFARGRILDLSYAAAQSLGVVRNGTAPVLVEAIGGPHHEKKGLFGGSSSSRPALALGKNDTMAETLPSYSPQAMKEEDLLSAPAYGLPAPPPVEERKLTSTVPLKNSLVYVQVGAYAEQQRANSQLKAMNNAGVDGRTDTLHSAGRALHRVRSGPYKTIAEAEAALAKLSNAGFSGAQIKVEE